ncbi:hypothetical protein TNCV_1367051 [Trichonephila clavipes]|nr:hypothetical protein TNCV_1367051 [Trichonephila clavipes]
MAKMLAFGTEGAQIESFLQSLRCVEPCCEATRSRHKLFPVLGEFWGVVRGQQLVSLERLKRSLLDSCLENTLAIPFVRFLPRKGNPPPG